MSDQDKLAHFLNVISNSLSKEVLVKLSMGNYHGGTADLKNVYVRPVLIKRKKMLSFIYRYKTRDICKNFSETEGLKIISELVPKDFFICTLATVNREYVIEINAVGRMFLRERDLVNAGVPKLEHDRQKKRLISAVDKTYLHDLRITDAEGQVLKNAQDKYRQINHYVEILSKLIQGFGPGEIKQVVDMGSGKGYLTFALYDYLNNIAGVQASVTGVEYRTDLVELCNRIANQSSFAGLNFVQGTIDSYPKDQFDLLIALHACDTATDDAIIKGIEAGAKLIVVAPCCHKQIRREMENNRVESQVSFLTKHGIFMERQAEMVTDGIRSLILEYYGYKTKIFEFISDVHTPKNVLIVGSKGQTNPERQATLLNQILEIKKNFGITRHYLEGILP